MLNSLLQEELKEIEEVQGFKITNIDEANWAFRKIRALQEEVKETNLLADKEKERIENWREKEIKTSMDNIEYFQGILTEYYMKLRSENPKAKLNTPYGKVTSRKSKKWNYQNEEEILKYLKENEYSDLIKVKEDINKAELKKMFKDGVNKETGEVLPGLEIKEEESISVKVE
ncbi:phage protein [Clostridium tetani]|uniref:Phage protein n=1 Tax=Clostridium tetani TaxID=1513 RepID=A0ABC8EAX6_CLOTA|nr:host-nuclease inhibitor Gam family protein [Clostridium tetani]BDR66694.1 phage protein [Clostridium tetani]BDR80665.1 phage protein [Clostridium tetani]BDR89121.1 phage protein [Clostridium tetani]